MRICGSTEMRAIDRAAIDGLGIPGIQLMERAGAAVAAAVQRRLARPSVVVYCGPGNNGGDGWVAARLLHGRGAAVQVVSAAEPSSLTGDARAAFEAAERAQVRWTRLDSPPPQPTPGPAVVVDALLGTGLSRPPDARLSEAIDRVDEARGRGAHVVAVDVPSGLSADTGQPLGRCVRADTTVTFAFMKRGLALFPGVTLAGEVEVADIGIPAEAASRVPRECELLTEAEVRALLPRLAPDAHKGAAGRVLVVAGSAGKSGAAHLSVAGALRGGAGLVTLASRPEVLPVALAGRPEAMSLALPGDGPLALPDLDPLVDVALASDAIVMGPGIPRGDGTARFLRQLADRARVPCVIDADALNALADAPDLLASWPVPAVLTPHPGEMGRLAKLSIGDVQRDRIGLAREKASSWGCVVLLKGARTVVADPEQPAAVIPTGNPGMATGGTGDVLAGLCGALLAGGMGPFDAARAAAWIHGRAGDLAARRHGQRGMLAGDLADELGAVWAEWGC
ncbi:MAG TPA: NAD(P)H-hydrate dehydratase [Anaeromyxobacteraceae bacterium]|nr:NAD(P)H-hydrate dehydratase [Anaeromyxobacteraceae bacterium]